MNKPWDEEALRCDMLIQDLALCVDVRNIFTYKNTIIRRGKNWNRTRINCKEKQKDYDEPQM